MAETSELRAALAPRAPRDQASALGAIAARLTHGIAAAGESTAEADAGVALIERWAGGEQIAGKAFSDAVYSDRDEGLARRQMQSKDPAAGELWNTLITTVMYVGWLVYTANNERMPEDISEVAADTLDMLDEQWRATGTYDPALFAPKS